jgi:hypothetical protein
MAAAFWSFRDEGDAEKLLRDDRRFAEKGRLIGARAEQIGREESFGGWPGCHCSALTAAAMNEGLRHWAQKRVRNEREIWSDVRQNRSLPTSEQRGLFDHAAAKPTMCNRGLETEVVSSAPRVKCLR